MDKYYRRGFLNEYGEGQACFEAKIDEDGWGGTFAIHDCARTATLDLDMTSKEERKNSLRKIDVLVAELQQLKRELVSRKKDFEERERRWNSN